MSFQKPARMPCLILATTLLVLGRSTAQTTSPGPDFSGIWQLNDKESDSSTVIEQRLHREKRREQAPSSKPASSSSSNAPIPSDAGFGGRGGRGMGGMGGGHGMRGAQRGHHGSQKSSSDHAAPPKDPTPPLLTDDSFLNVRQSDKGMRVDFNNTDRLDTRFDGISRQTLDSNARVKTQLTPTSMHMSMAFDDGTRLDEIWVRSPDAHHLTVTETWTTDEVKQPIVFKRVYDRLDL